jgi:uroporphyrin-III C-methyltransferase/precorrin-2 dehydrogenase/sirohydrochlorin ferrochelatase
VSDQSDLLPVFLKLAGRRVLVVGGGQVAAAKIGGLLRAGASVTVVAPEVAPAIARSGVPVEQRRFTASDLHGVWFVVTAATPEVNREVARIAERHRVFVNAVDDPASASAYLGGVVRRHGVTIAISTDGRAPAIAGLLREGLEALLPLDLDRWLECADALRREWRLRQVPMERRRPRLLEALFDLYTQRGETSAPKALAP